MTITFPRHYFLFSSASREYFRFMTFCDRWRSFEHDGRCWNAREMIQKLSFIITWAFDVTRGLWSLTLLLKFNPSQLMRYSPLIAPPPASAGGKFMAIFFTFAFALLIFTLWKIYRAAWSLSTYTLHLSDFTFQLDLACARTPRRTLPKKGGQGRGRNFHQHQRGLLRCLITRSDSWPEMPTKLFLFGFCFRLERRGSIQINFCSPSGNSGTETQNVSAFRKVTETWINSGQKFLFFFFSPDIILWNNRELISFLVASWAALCIVEL